MRRDNRQLSLFAPRPALPSHRFSLDPSPAEIRLCKACGRAIITQGRTAHNEIVSEYVSATGVCFQCAHPNPVRAKTRRRRGTRLPHDNACL